MIIAVTDREHTIRPFTEQLRLIAEGRPDMVIIRDKNCSIDEFREFAAECRDICSEFDVDVCVNTYCQIAKELGIRKVQLPMQILSERKGKDDSILTGASVHSIQDAKDAEELGADWLVFGNVFETSCKVGKAGAGTDMLKEVCESTSLPVYAIGGVTADNIRSVMRSGASGACIMSGLMMAERPSEVIDRLRRNFNLQSKISIL